jgi:glycosyltransferase involved in cell wall biosynthesis
MKIGILYDFSIKKGGGDFVMLNILEALQDMYDITLITSKPKGFYEACNNFDKVVDKFKLYMYEIKVPLFLRHPYTIVYMAKKVSNESNYDLFILSDDVPACLSNRRVISYFHFPHVARLRFGEHIMRKYTKTLRGRIEWWVHKRLFKKFYPTRQVSDRWLFIANSIFTKEYIAKSFNIDSKRIILLNPPVASASINALWRESSVQKEDLVVCIGWFEPVKGFDDVVNALSLMKNKPRLRLIGFVGDKIYLERLVSLVKSLGLEDVVSFFLSSRRDFLINSLLKAKVIVHPAPREHFGIAVLEGMAAGCIPIVRVGFNGPWMEILQEGKYGLGFKTTKELAFAMERAVKMYEDFDINKIISRALVFDESRFRSKFSEIVNQFLSQA